MKREMLKLIRDSGFDLMGNEVVYRDGNVCVVITSEVKRLMDAMLLRSVSKCHKLRNGCENADMVLMADCIESSLLTWSNDPAEGV